MRFNCTVWLEMPFVQTCTYQKCLAHTTAHSFSSCGLTMQQQIVARAYIFSSAAGRPTLVHTQTSHLSAHKHLDVKGQATRKHQAMRNLGGLALHACPHLFTPKSRSTNPHTSERQGSGDPAAPGPEGLGGRALLASPHLFTHPRIKPALRTYTRRTWMSRVR